MAELLEEELVERARRGDTEAYRMIVQSHQDVAVRTAYLITGSAEDAEEVAQDAFVKAFRALARFRRGEPFRPWLLTIVGNEARNRRRANAARPALVPGEEERAADAAPSSDARVMLAADRALLRRALTRLSQDDRDVIACRFFLDLAERETAAVLGLRPGTVKSRLSRALERLRTAVEADR